jgi:prepilin-type processing-associated H-X9-DG protein
MAIGDGRSNLYGGDSSSFRISNGGAGFNNLTLILQAARHPGISLNFAYVDGHVGNMNAKQVNYERTIGSNSLFFDTNQQY